MVEADQGADDGEVHAARVKRHAGGVCCQGHGLGGTIEVEDRAGFALWAKGMDALAGLQVVVHGRTCAWDCVLTMENIFLFSWRAWRGCREWKVPEPGTGHFPPTLEDTAAVSMVHNKVTCLGEGDGVAKIGKWPQTYEGVGERKHDVALHGCRGKRGNQSKCCAHN